MESGGYDKGYVACPYCQKNIDAGYLSEAMTADEPEKKDDAPAKKEEPEKKSEEPEKKDAEKEAAAASKIVRLKSPSHQTVMLTPESRAKAKALLAGDGWKKAAGTYIGPQRNSFREACNHNLEEIRVAMSSS